jgi:hypothetical protein
VFLPSDGPAQLATGALITFLFLLLNLTCRPFCTPGLNNLQSFSLISQFLTLFCGILIGYREAMQQTAEASTASDSAEQEESRIFGNIIVVINCGTLAFPLDGKNHVCTQTTFHVLHGLVWGEKETRSQDRGKEAGASC